MDKAQHHASIVDPVRFFGRYWWICSCGDEGGPHDSYNEAWDATVAHERASATEPAP